MKKAVMIHDSCTPKTFRYKDSVYCIDPEQPSVIRINEDVNRILASGRGKAPEELLEAFPDSGQAIKDLAGLKEMGFFQQGQGADPLILDEIKTLCLAVSGACNFRCRYCYESGPSGEVRTSLMSGQTARQSIDFLVGSSPEGSLGIDFFGGEPLLNFGVISDTVNYCANKKRDFRFSLTTNGSLVDQNVADFLERNGFSVVLSLDGPAHVHDAMRRGKKGSRTFEAVLRGFRILKERIPPTRLTCTGILTRRFPFPAKLLEEYRNMEVPRVALNSVSAHGDVEIELDREAMGSIATDEQAICEEIISSGTVPTSKYLPIAQYMRILGKEERKLTRCGAGIDNLAVSAEGKFYLCHRFLDNEQFALGNIWNGIDEIKRREMLAGRSSPSCPDCWARHICGGPCLHDSWAYTGSIHSIVPSKCDRIRHLIELAAVALGELMKKDKSLVCQYM